MIDTEPGTRPAESGLNNDDDNDLPFPPGSPFDRFFKRFGAPNERHPAVGTPAITRWDYPAFAVYFEKDRVIHAVVMPTP